MNKHEILEQHEKKALKLFDNWNYFENSEIKGNFFINFVGVKK